MIHQASIDRAIAFLLDVAEGNVPVTDDRTRIEAATVVLSANSFGDCFEDDNADVAALAIEASEGAVDMAFREGARWGRRHPRGGLPGRERILQLVTEKLGAAS